MTNLTERLDQHIQNIREGDEEIINDIEKVKKIINKNQSHLDKSTISCYKAMLNCCKSGKFIPSNELEKALIEWGMEFVGDTVESEEEIKAAIEDLYEEDAIESFREEILRYVYSFNGLYNIWIKGLDYIERQLWDKMCNKVKAKLN